MDHTGTKADGLAADTAAHAGPRLAVVGGRAHPADLAAVGPQEWAAALGALLAWLADDAESAAVGMALPNFAPWTAWCPTALQNGGCAGLPAARFLASYCLEHPRASADPRQGGADVLLLSPHPAACAGALPLAGVLHAMIRAAWAERRERIAIIVHARDRVAAARRFGEDPRLCPPGTQIDVLGIEEALPALMARPSGWEAIIAMPDLRGTVFAVLAAVTGVRGPWPLMWHGQGVERITAEALGTGAGAKDLPLDAAVLIQALALALAAAGRDDAARRLHEGWARLRDRGVTTASQGGAHPYATEVSDAELIALLCRDDAASRRAQAPWRALETKQMSVFGNRTPTLRIVSSNLARP